MNRALRVDDRVALPAVLGALMPEALDLHWSVLDLGEVVPGSGWDRRGPFREPRVPASPRGWRLTFGELLAFAEWAGQIIDGLFVGCASAEKLPRRSDDDATIIASVDMVVAALDSSFWLVGAPDAVLLRAAHLYERVSEVDPGAVRLSTHRRDDGDTERALLPLKVDLP